MGIWVVQGAALPCGYITEIIKKTPFTTEW